MVGELRVIQAIELVLTGYAVFSDRKPVFEIEDSPEVSDVGRLVKRLESEAEKAMATAGKSLYSNANGGFVDVVSPSHVRSHATILLLAMF